MSVGENRTITRPTEVRCGDVMVFWLVSDTNLSSLTVTFPAGWVRPSKPVLRQNLVGVSGDAGGFAVAWRVATANEPSSYTATVVDGSSSNSAGIVVLSGVTARGMVQAWTQPLVVLTSPWRLAMRGVSLRAPSELLWLGSTDQAVTGVEVPHTPPAGFRTIGHYENNGYNQVFVAHRVASTPSHTGTHVAEAVYGTSKASLMGYLLAFPIAGRPLRAPPPLFRTLRPSFDISNTGWGVV
jgi:hypothetical protein